MEQKTQEQTLADHANVPKPQREGVYAAMSEWERQQNKVLRGLLSEVIRYYRGEGKYNFTKYDAQQRENEAFDAWQELSDRIQQHLLTT